jgi:hypothetical protein
MGKIPQIADQGLGFGATTAVSYSYSEESFDSKRLSVSGGFGT